MFGKDLASQIRDYSTSAKILEAERKDLVDKILDIVKTEIIPEVTPCLPMGYSIDAKSIKVDGVSEESFNNNPVPGNVPTGFSVSLRMLYENKPIPSRSPLWNEVYNIQKHPKLEELAKKYNLVKITPSGEPLYI